MKVFFSERAFPVLCLAEMLRTQAVQKWPQVLQTDPVQPEVCRTRR